MSNRVERQSCKFETSVQIGHSEFEEEELVLEQRKRDRDVAVMSERPTKKAKKTKQRCDQCDKRVELDKSVTNDKWFCNDCRRDNRQC